MVLVLSLFFFFTRICLCVYLTIPFTMCLQNTSAGWHLFPILYSCQHRRYNPSPAKMSSLPFILNCYIRFRSDSMIKCFQRDKCCACISAQVRVHIKLNSILSFMLLYIFKCSYKNNFTLNIHCFGFIRERNRTPVTGGESTCLCLCLCFCVCVCVWRAYVIVFTQCHSTFHIKLIGLSQLQQEYWLYKESAQLIVLSRVQIPVRALTRHHGDCETV